MSKHKHHIIPKYKCKELGIDPDFDENYVMVDRLDHARIHWGYKCDDLEPLFEYITPAQWIIDLIPRGDNRDVGAAVLTAKGEIDGIVPLSGENHWKWKGGISVGDNKTPYMKLYQQTPAQVEYQAKYMVKYWRQPKNKDKTNARRKERYANDSDYRKRELERGKRYRAKNTDKIRRQERERYARKKAKRQGVGTLEDFLK